MPTPLRVLAVLFVLLLSSGTVLASGRRPLDAETAILLAPGAVDVEMGFEAARDAERPLFPGFKGSAMILPVVGLRTGLGAWGELRLEGDVFVRFDPDQDRVASGPGDWRVHAKIRVGPTGRRLQWAALFGAKIPVASDNQGLGTNLADVEARALLHIAAGPTRIDLNGGVAVLGAPFRERAQVDVLTYAAAVRGELRPGWELNGEIAGREGGDFTPARSMLRVGTRISRRSWRFDGALGAGLAGASPALEIRLGATYRFQRGPRPAKDPPP